MRILNGTLSFYECRLSGVAIQRLWGHSNPTCRDQIFCPLSPIEPPCETFTIFKLMIITARKPSLGQGNVFTNVCHVVHRGEGSLYDVTSCLAAWSHVPRRFLSLVPCSFQGVSVQGKGSLSRGRESLSMERGSMFRGSLSMGSLSGRPHPVGEEWAVRIQLERMLV